MRCWYNNWCVISVSTEDSCLKVNHAIIMCFKEKQRCCKNSFYLVQEWFILWILTASLMIPFWKQTVPLSFFSVMGNGPMNYNSCLEFFLRLTRILSPTLYWWLFRRIFSRMLLWLIRYFLCCWMCSQSATCLVFKMASRPNASCIGDACSVVW